MVVRVKTEMEFQKVEIVVYAFTNDTMIQLVGSILTG